MAIRRLRSGRKAALRHPLPLQRTSTRLNPASRPLALLKQEVQIVQKTPQEQSSKGSQLTKLEVDGRAPAPKPCAESGSVETCCLVHGNGTVDSDTKNQAKKGRKEHDRVGRPRLYSVRTVKHSATAFIVAIKYNVRNRLAKRLKRDPDAPPKPVVQENVIILDARDARLSRPARTTSRGLVDHADSSGLLDINSARGEAIFRKMSETTGRERKKVDRSGPAQTRRVVTQPPSAQIGPMPKSPHKYNFKAPAAEQHPAEPSLPYLGVLPYPDCIINDTEPTALDRHMFNKFRAVGARRQQEVQTKVQAEMAESQAELSPRSGSSTPVPQNASLYFLRSRIEHVCILNSLLRTWYSSPFPEEFSRNKVLYMCEFCLKYMSSPKSFERHQIKACGDGRNHPPGREIYRDARSRIAFWEVDGRKNIDYCQSLCLLAKLFLNSKTLYYDVEPFLFYVLTEIDERDPSTYHFVGYFSKEKLNNSDYNVSCILTLPLYQRKGYGHLMIDLSYLLTRKEFKHGTPEKPLSDLGLVSYRNYWKIAVAHTLQRMHREVMVRADTQYLVSLEILSKITGIKPSDVVVGLEQLEALIRNKDANTYAIVVNVAKVDEVVRRWAARNYVRLRPELCVWKPLLYGPSGGINSAPNVVPPQNSAAQPVTNSIAMLSGFLKDDVINPLSLEEEAVRDIEQCAKPVKPALADGSVPQVTFDPKQYVVCHPDFAEGIPMKAVQPEHTEIRIAELELSEAAEFGYDTDADDESDVVLDDEYGENYDNDHEDEVEDEGEEEVEDDEGEEEDEEGEDEEEDEEGEDEEVDAEMPRNRSAPRRSLRSEKLYVSVVESDSPESGAEESAGAKRRVPSIVRQLQTDLLSPKATRVSPGTRQAKLLRRNTRKR